MGIREGFLHFGLLPEWRPAPNIIAPASDGSHLHPCTWRRGCIFPQRFLECHCLLKITSNALQSFKGFRCEVLEEGNRGQYKSIKL